MCDEFEIEAARRGYKRIYLQALLSAIPFYKKCNFTMYGEEFLDHGLPHRHFHKYTSIAEDSNNL